VGRTRARATTGLSCGRLGFATSTKGVAGFCFPFSLIVLAAVPREWFWYMWKWRDGWRVFYRVVEWWDGMFVIGALIMMMIVIMMKNVFLTKPARGKAVRILGYRILAMDGTADDGG